MIIKKEIIVIILQTLIIMISCLVEPSQFVERISNITLIMSVGMIKLQSYAITFDRFFISPQLISDFSELFITFFTVGFKMNCTFEHLRSNLILMGYSIQHLKNSYKYHIFLMIEIMI